MKLTLAIITGNVGGALMRRFLDNFQKLADEVVVVRAIGNQKPDDTLDVAHNAGCVVAEYRNEKGKDWPHVDDFAAARNMAWQIAEERGADWVMWADTDDIISEQAARAIRQTIERKGDQFDMLMTPYCVPDASISDNIRERVVRAGIARWVQPVHEYLMHECLEPKDPKGKWRTVRCQEGRIVHDPGPRPPAARNGRNLRILQSLPESELTTSLAYHLMAEHFAMGNKDEGAKAAEAFLLRKDAGENERFEAMLSMCFVSDDPNDKAEWLKLAWHESPKRREPLVLLANIAQNAGQLDVAESYLTAASALPMPEPAPWNLRRKMYGWQFIQEQARLLRARENFAKADALEFNHFVRSGGKISLLHATRGRPEKALEIRNLWLDRAENADAVEHIFGLDPDDPTGPALGGFRHIVQDIGGGPCGAWNMACSIASGQVFVQVSDDMIPPMGWDRRILDALGDTQEPKVLRVSDGHRKDGLIVLAIVTRAWVKQQGYLFHPAFFSMYSDNWLTECAEREGAIVEARDIVFEHRHPVFTGEPWHPTTAASNHPERYAEGEAILKELRESFNKSGKAKAVIMAHDSVAEFTRASILPGWQAIAEASIDFPSTEENAHSGRAVQRRFIRVIKDALADDTWGILAVAEWDSYTRASAMPTPPPRAILSCRWTNPTWHCFSLLCPWIMDRGAAMALVRYADSVPEGNGNEALLDQWIGRLAAVAKLDTPYLERSHAHPPEGIGAAAKAGMQFIHPIKTEADVAAIQ